MKIKLLIITILSVLLGNLLINKVKAQEGVYCFPNCDEENINFISVVGGDTDSFSNINYNFVFSVPSNAQSLEIGVFDGDSGLNDDGVVDVAEGNWDNTNVSYSYKLFADPQANGSDMVLLYEWDANTDMINNAWWTTELTPSEEAQSPNGNYFYRLEVGALGPDNGVSAFKMRSNYPIFIPEKILGLISMLATQQDTAIVYPEFSGDYYNPGPSIYDGYLNMYLYKSVSSDSIMIWDGDTDFGAADGSTVDSDDPDTLNDVLPDWVEGVGVENESAKGEGSPGDDSGTTFYRFSPSVNINLTTNEGEEYLNFNPSGKSEWEQFLVTQDESVVADYYLDDLVRPGLQKYSFVGLDIFNTTFIKADRKIVSVDEEGNPAIPYFPFSIGGTVWNDEDGDGTQDGDELGFTNVNLEIYDSNGYLLDEIATDSIGNFSYDVEALTNDVYSGEILQDGEYTVKISDTNFNEGNVLDGANLTTDSITSTVTVQSNNEFGFNFGYVLAAEETELPQTGGFIGGKLLIILILVVLEVLTLFIKGTNSKNTFRE